MRRQTVTARGSWGMERVYSQGSVSGMRRLQVGWVGVRAVALPQPSWQDGVVRFRAPGVSQRVRRVTDGMA
ncbi:hypothetical protein GCM10022232_25510 [Streptomyces plumbiresistens]|uniref:Uncharacterized protein n=1 Tax=Streptomyces plumbiresistens TaxID=511811 RepID=A0ABP7QZD6_9ACTN